MNEYLIKTDTIKATADAIRTNLPPTVEYKINPEVTENQEAFRQGAVNIHYYEYVDYTMVYDEAIPEGRSTDEFVAYDHLPNNEGIIVPVIYKANITVTDYQDEYYGPDYGDSFFYQGEVVIDGQTYNKWRKIENGELVFGWDTSSKQYVYTNVIVEAVTKPNVEKIDPADFPSKVHEVHGIGYDKGFNEAKTEYGGLLESIIDRSITTLDLTKFENLSTIGAYAFCQCTNLTDVILPNTLELTIGEYAFYNCTNLGTVYYSGTKTDWDTYITIGEGNEPLLNSISYYSETDEQDGAISYWRYVDGVPTLWDSVSKGLEYKLLDDGTYSITGIGTCIDTDLVIPKKYNMVLVTSIDTLAFDGCDSLTSVTISDTIISIGNTAFHSCSGLTEIVIPDSVKNVGSHAFGSCDNLISVTMGNSITELSYGIFSYCSNLPNVTIPNSVTTIGEHAFSNCKNLANITIPDSVTTIGEYAFQKCDRLTSIVIPDSVTSIGVYAFNSCDVLENATIGNGITTIEAGMFYYCTNLTSVTIGNNVLSIGKNAFSSCSALTNVYYCSDVDKWQTITIQSGNDCLINATRYYRFAASALCLYRINNDWTGYIAYDWNNDSDDLTQGTLSIDFIINNLPVVGIADDAFAQHNEVAYAYIGGNVTYIGKNVLSECPNLQEITIPTSVTHIGENALNSYYDGDPSKIIYKGNAIQWNAIVKDMQYENVTFLAPLPEHTDEQGIIYTSSDDNTYYICSNGEAHSEPDIVIADYIGGVPVKEIGGRAFEQCYYITSIEIPDTITDIGILAFDSCYYLADVTIGNNVINISDSAFGYCKNLTSISIPASVTNMTGEVFYGCKNLTNITVDVNNEQFKSIDNNLYTKDGTTLVLYAPGKRVARFIIPDGVEVIGSGAFGDCDMLTSITIPAGLTTIERHAFDNCDGLTSITLPNSVTSIDEEAFFECSSINIYVPWSEGEVANAPWGTTGEVIYNYSE